MSREKFLKALQHFDDNYNGIVYNDKELDELYRTNKKFNNDERSRSHSQHHSRIDIVKVRQITQINDNCFTPFYSLKDDQLYYFFGQLSNIHLGLIYLDDFCDNYRDLKMQNRNKSKQKKIDEVMEMLSADSNNYETTIKDLNCLQNSLDNDHFTERQLFQHLLFWVSLMLNNLKQNRKVSDVTNDMIKDYFSQDVTFSRETKIDNFEPFTYYYTDAKGLILYHS